MPKVSIPHVIVGALCKLVDTVTPKKPNEFSNSSK